MRRRSPPEDSDVWRNNEERERVHAQDATHLEDAVEPGGAEHVLAGARDVGRAVADASGAHTGAVAAGELEDEGAFSLRTGFEHGARGAGVSAPPVGEGRARGGRGDGDGRELGTEDGGGDAGEHGGGIGGISKHDGDGGRDIGGVDGDGDGMMGRAVDHGGGRGGCAGILVGTAGR